MGTENSTNLTKALLACGIAAGCLYVALGAGQALSRSGFDPTRHPLSLLSNGEEGWIQIANFLVCGALVIACAAGMRRAVAGEFTLSMPVRLVR